MFKKGLKLSSLLSLLLLFATATFAQVTGGSVTGTVVDSNGAVVPNATVTLTGKARGQNLTTQTTDTGSYTFPNVPVGDYTITVEIQGFSKATQELRVTLNQATTVEVTMQPQGVGASVDVSNNSEAIVQTDSSQLGKSFDSRKVSDLPIFGNPNTLALLAPNTADRSAGVVGDGAVVGGIRPRGNTFNVDGVDNNDASITGPAVGVIQDSVEEFTLLQNNFNAEFGNGSGGIFNTITKSGTNQFHGSGFTYIQSQKLNATSSLEEEEIRAGNLTEKPLFKQARYGGTLGGPIVKNKLFFFGAYERTFLDQALPATVYTAPTAAGLNQIAALPGASPFVVNLLRNNLVLAPNQTTTQTVLGVGGIPFGTVSIPTPASFSGNSFQVNVDHLPNDKNQFRYRFGYDRQRAEQAGGGNIKFNNNFAFESQLFSATWIRTFSSNLVNDLRLSFRNTQQDFPLKDPAFNTFPNITVDSLNLALGPGPNLPQGTPVDQNYQIADALSYTRGNHSFKFGGEMRRLIFTSIFLPRQRGDYNYSDLDVLLSDERPDVLDLRGVGAAGFTGNRFEWAFFGQDDWKIRSNFTLNLGLRYEYESLPRDSASQALNAIANVPGVIEFNVPKTDKNNFAPRVGFAYSPNGRNSVTRFLFGENGRSSIRANFAISYFTNFQNLHLLNLPPQFAQERDGEGFNTQFLQNGGIPNALLPTNTTDLARAATSSYIADQTSPYSMSWNFSYQRQLTGNMGIEFRYLGTRARHLPIQVRLNAGRVDPADLRLPTFFSQPTAAQLAGRPTFLTVFLNSPTMGIGALEQYGFLGSVTAFQPVGNSQYDGGSVSLTRAFSKNFGFTAAYTFSKTIDDSTNELNTSALNPRRPQNSFNLRDERGLSALDIPHRLAISFNYDIAYFNNNENKFLKHVLGNWSINGIFQAQSGQPVTVRSGVDSNVDLDAAGDRAIFNPNGVAGTSSRVCPLNAAGQMLTPGAFLGPGAVTTDINQCGLGNYGPTNAVAYLVVNPNAQFIETGFGAASNVGRNTFRTRGFNNTDAVFLKNIYFGSDNRFNLQVGTEINNLFNQRQRTIFGVGAQTAAFSIAGNNFFNDYSTGNYFGRVIQMRAKFIF